MDYAGKPRVEPNVLYGGSDVSSLCRGDDATQNVSRARGVIIKKYSLHIWSTSTAVLG